MQIEPMERKHSNYAQLKNKPHAYLEGHIVLCYNGLILQHENHYQYFACLSLPNARTFFIAFMQEKHRPSSAKHLRHQQHDFHKRHYANIQVQLYWMPQQSSI